MLFNLKKTSLLVLCTFGLTMLTACNAEESSKPTATPGSEKPALIVNGVAIPQSKIDLVIQQQAAQGQPSSPELLKAIKENIITNELLTQEAIKKGFDKKPDVITQIEMTKSSILARAYVQDFAKSNPVSDVALKAEFDRIKAQMGDKEYKARHILVDSEQTAKDIIAQLKKDPKKFEKLAADKSKDPSKAKGGDLGWSAPGNFVTPFADAMVALKKGQFTEKPVQSQFGWHVIRLDDMRDMKAPPLEEVKPQLSQRIQQQMIEKLIGDLRAKAKIEEPGAAPAAGKAEEKK
jgi:peptidyl-prolyl cis-trans isomerase C